MRQNSIVSGRPDARQVFYRYFVLNGFSESCFNVLMKTSGLLNSLRSILV